MELIILESPFAGDVGRNIAYARACVRDALIRGESPIASHLLFTQTGILNDDLDFERKLGIRAGLEWGKKAAKTIVYCDLGISAGMQIGINHARSNNRPVEFRHIGVPHACRPVTPCWWKKVYVKLHAIFVAAFHGPPPVIRF